MARRNQANEGEDIARTLVGVAAGAAAAYGAYKLFSSVFGSDGPVEHESGHAHSSSRNNLTSMPFSIKSTYKFPANSKIILVETQDECRSAVELLQS